MQWSVSYLWENANGGHPEARPTQLGHNQVAWCKTAIPGFLGCFRPHFLARSTATTSSAMGLEQPCLQTLPARTRTAHLWFTHSSSCHQGRSLYCDGPVRLNIGTEVQVCGWTRVHLPLCSAPLVGLGSSSLHCTYPGLSFSLCYPDPAPRFPAASML